MVTRCLKATSKICFVLKINFILYILKPNRFCYFLKAVCKKAIALLFCVEIQNLTLSVLVLLTLEHVQAKVTLFCLKT